MGTNTLKLCPDKMDVLLMNGSSGKGGSVEFVLDRAALSLQDQSFSLGC